MTLTYKIGNIFDIPLGWDIVHCVTADFLAVRALQRNLMKDVISKKNLKHNIFQQILLVLV